MATAARAAPASGQTQMESQAQPTQTITQQAVLHLRGAERESEDVQGGETRRRIQWAEDVVDNEGMGKKKSKVCCIYHAPKEFGESSDESSSDSSDSDSGDDGSARPPRRQGHNHDHNHNHDHGKGKGKGKGKGRGRSTSPNAYEKMPKPKSNAPKGK